MAPAPIGEGNPLFQGVVKESAAFRLMKRMGWEEGTGLGKEKQGIKQHLKVKNKQDTSGIGIDAQKKAENIWTFNTTAFDSILKNLKVQAAGTETRESLPKDDTIEQSILDDHKGQKVARPQGRYKKCESGKRVRSYSQTDLNAILGNNGWNPSTSASSKDAEQHQTDGVLGRDLRSSPQDGSESRIDVSRINDMETFQSEGVWWGKKYGFVSGGHLGGDTGEQKCCTRAVDDEKRDLVQLRPSFSEMDQENLYKLVQDKATTGKQGLGKGRSVKKIGHAWAGRKTELGTPSDDEGDEMEMSRGGVIVGNQPDNFSTETCFQKTKPSKRKYASLFAENTEGGQVRQKDAQAWIDSPKQDDAVEGSKKCSTAAEGSILSWKKICEKILLEAPGHELSLKRLHKRLKRELKVAGGESVSSCLDIMRFKEKIQKSSKFEENKNKVHLTKISS